MRVHSLILAAVLVACAAIPAMAQTGRATGLVVDRNNRPIKGAVVTASNSQAARSRITSTTDDKGRFAMIGLRAGVWTIAAEAPGFVPMEGSFPIRSATVGPPMRFVLERSLEPVPGALSRNIDEEIAEAQALRAEGRYDQAIAAYETLLDKHPKLTALNLVIAGTYRQKAGNEPDAAVRQTLLERAIASYGAMLRADAENDRARLELGATHLTAGNLALARTTFQEIVSSDPGSPAAAEAAAHLQGMPE